LRDCDAPVLEGISFNIEGLMKKEEDG